MNDIPERQLDVSLVLVCFQMQRELPRTLASLAPGYQRDCPAGAVEIIVVDNGSAPPVDGSRYGDLNLRLAIHRHPNPSLSPAPAANLGLRLAQAPLVGLWIDAARMASPGLLRAAIDASRLHPRPVIATYNYHLGSRLQYFSAAEEHTAAVEDSLLAAIEWPLDGYRLFEIATLDAKEGLTGPLLESCALFMPQALWRELGGADESFVSRGGGAVNPDIFIRACGLADVQLIRILGEGTFHQVHGGVSTSGGAQLFSAGKEMSREYYRIRGRPISAVRTPGWLYDPATRSIQR